MNISPSDFREQGPFKIAGNTKGTGVAWTSITSKASDGSFDNVTLGGKSVEVASMSDYTKLRDNTEQGYGILYGDEAVGVQTDLNKAYGYQRDENGDADPTYGMRGCFAYIGYKQGNTTNPKAEHLFFPIGASGYGHRKEGGVHGFGAEEIGRGFSDMRLDEWIITIWATDRSSMTFSNDREPCIGQNRRRARVWRLTSIISHSISMCFHRVISTDIKTRAPIIPMPAL